MTNSSRAMLAGLLALGVLPGTASAAPAPGNALLAKPSAQTLIAPVHYRYRCWVRRCGPYRCVWINRCRW